jgi:hypothetical protein
VSAYHLFAFNLSSNLETSLGAKKCAIGCLGLLNLRGRVATWISSLLSPFLQHAYLLTGAVQTAKLAMYLSASYPVSEFFLGTAIVEGIGHSEPRSIRSSMRGKKKSMKCVFITLGSGQSDVLNMDYSHSPGLPYNFYHLGAYLKLRYSDRGQLFDLLADAAASPSDRLYKRLCLRLRFPYPFLLFQITPNSFSVHGSHAL